jgi:hypothetical protein
MAAEEKLNKRATHRIVLTQCGHRFFTSGRPFHDRCFDQSDTSCSEERGSTFLDLIEKRGAGKGSGFQKNRARKPSDFLFPVFYTIFHFHEFCNM